MSKKKRGAVRTRTSRNGTDTIDGRPARGGGATDGVAQSAADDALWQAIRSPLRLRLLEAIRAAPGVDVRALSGLLGTSAPGLYYHINILLACGLIEGHELGAPPAPRAPAAPRLRKGSRGPIALAFRARDDGFPDGFFARHDRARLREETLVGELFNRGLSFAFKSPHDTARNLVARTEHLTQPETSKLKALLRQVEEVLDGARARRHAGAHLVAATHFVGCVLTAVDGSELPDGPLPAR
jgi:hypothetical protein